MSFENMAKYTENITKRLGIIPNIGRLLKIFTCNTINSINSIIATTTYFIFCIFTTYSKTTSTYSNVEKSTDVCTSA